MTPHEKSRRVKAIARDIGFDLAGVTHAGRVAQSEYYRQWLDNSYCGTMEYLRRNVELRETPERILPGARAIVCVALNYKRETRDREFAESANADANSQGGNCAMGRVAQYSRGADYHVVMRRMLDALAQAMRDEINEPFEARVFVDTGPLLERQLAAAAGLGWIGKNTCLLNDRVGSFTFLGEIITTLDLAPDNSMPDHCGSCTRCLDACPTQALVEPYRMDASRCISYFTIEHRGDIPREFHAGIGDWVYGCDICQDVCPFNSHAPIATNPAITADRIPARLPLQQLTELSAGDHKRLTRGTAASRARPQMWRRNAAIALANAERAREAN